MRPHDVSTGYSLTIFFLICKNVDNYKIVEATEIVGSRRIVRTLRRPSENAIISIVRSSQANHRPKAQPRHKSNNGADLQHTNIYHIDRTFICISVQVAIPLSPQFSICYILVFICDL